MATYTLSGSIDINPALTGTIHVLRANRYTPEDRKEAIGYRPSTPLLVNSMSVLNLTSIAAANVPIDGHFVMSPSFAGTAGDPLYDQGAKPGSIGTKTLHEAAVVYVFREPYLFEVVWHVALDDVGAPTELGFQRWRDGVWKAYKTWPERAVAGQAAFTALDPDGIYDYYARLMGATMTEWMVDARALTEFIDPNLCPLDLLPLLGQNFGLKTNAAEPEEVQRRTVGDAIPTFKQKGLARAVSIRLRSLGYSGYPLEIWVNPDNPANYKDDLTGEKGIDWIEVIHGSRNRAPHIGLQFVGAAQPFDGETVTVDDYITQVTFGFGSGGDVTVPIGADAFETRDNLVAAIDASALVLDAKPLAPEGDPELLLTMGRLNSACAALRIYNYYVPSSRIALHINQTGGQPISMLTPAAELARFKQFIAAQLGEDVLPAQVDIRFFATDLEVGNGFGTGEEVAVGDTIVLTDV